MQAELAARRVSAPLPSPLPRFVAGVDAGFADGGRTVVAVAVVCDRDAGCAVVEARQVRRAVAAPYIPTFLSFREGPAVAEALGKLRHPFGVVLFDGQGLAHPRRCGLATHVGVQLDLPSVGVAKSRLIGEPRGDLPESAGAVTPLIDRGEVVGAVVRTRAGVRPVFVSPGHRCDLASAVAVVLACVVRCRVPEPTRQADRQVAEAKRLRVR